MLDPYLRLAAGIMIQAVKDVQKGDPGLAPEARQWLETVGVEWGEILGLNPVAVIDWLGKPSQETRKRIKTR